MKKSTDPLQKAFGAIIDSEYKDVRVQKYVNHLTEELNLTLCNTLDAVAPLKTKNICHKKQIGRAHV